MAPPLRILHLTAGSDAGGLSRYIFNLCRAMQEAGHEVAVAGQRGAWHQLFEGAPWPWIDVPLKAGPIGLAYATYLLKAHLQRHPVDLIHSHYRKCTLVARRLQKQFDLPILYTVHLPRIGLSGWRRWLSDFGDHCHVPSEDARRWLIEEARVAPERITVIPHGIQFDRFPERDDKAKFAARCAFNLSMQNTVAAFVGRLDFPKNPEWILDVADAARSRLPEARFVMMGSGPDESAVRAEIAQRKLQDIITLLPDGDPLPVYQAADAVLIPSLREGFSFVCGEAMSVGVPVLRTQGGGSKEMILEGVTGRSTPVDRAEFCRQALDFLAEVPALRQMGRAAAQHMRQHFSFDRQVEETIKLYHALVHDYQHPVPRASRP